jgi:hypothetical protein
MYHLSSSQVFRHEIEIYFYTDVQIVLYPVSQSLLILITPSLSYIKIPYWRVSFWGTLFYKNIYLSSHIPILYCLNIALLTVFYLLLCSLKFYTIKSLMMKDMIVLNLVEGCALPEIKSYYKPHISTSQIYQSYTMIMLIKSILNALDIYYLEISLRHWFSIFSSFLLQYIHCTGGFIVTIQNRFTLFTGLINPTIYKPIHTHLLLGPLKQLQQVSLFHFIHAYEVHQPCSHTFISSITLSSSHNHPTHTLYLLYSPVLLLIQSFFLIKL